MKSIQVIGPNGKQYTVTFNTDGLVSCISRRDTGSLRLGQRQVWTRHSSRGWGPILTAVVNIAATAPSDRNILKPFT